MPNPNNNDFENWDSPTDLQNWTETVNGGEVNRTEEAYSGIYGCELNIPTPILGSGKYAKIKSEDFVVGTSITIYMKKSASSGNLNNYAAYVGILVYRASDNFLLKYNLYYNGDFTTEYQKYTLDTTEIVGQTVYCVFILELALF